MCVDFTDLNRACPKDCYPFPRIDKLVDSTTGCEIFCFLDAFKGYHQIALDEEDQEKTAFITEYGTYCYTTMPFGFKNAGATYQRLVNKLFKNQIDRNMEVYVDDMLVKSRTQEQFINDLREIFDILRSSRMRLNPKKCTFGVRSGKFLGYMISKDGVRANPDKVKAIIDMAPPRNIKEVQRLAGRMAALSRFLSKLAVQGSPFFKALRRGPHFEWTSECQKAFDELKAHIARLPALTSPTQGETLFIYLAVGEEALSAVLVREEDKVQKPVYYVSRALQGAEPRYAAVERYVLALVHAARKLRSYFQAHPVIVVTDQPLKQILSKPDASGRMMKWAVELSEYDLGYQPCTAIKAQALADFIVEGVSCGQQEVQAKMTRDTAEAEQAGEAAEVPQATKASKAGLARDTAEAKQARKTAKARRATNNESEYEALIAGIMIARKLGTESIEVYSDSQLIVNQVGGNYEVKEEPLRRYVAKVHELRTQFKLFTLKQVPRSQNKRADALSKLASTSSGTLNKEVLVEVVRDRAYDQVDAAVIQILSSWMNPLVRYLANGELPSSKVEARKILLKSRGYVLTDGVLYRKSYLRPWLKCVTSEEGSYILRELHEGLYGNHVGPRMLAKKGMQSGYYWPTIFRDSAELEAHCRSCQLHSPVHHAPTQEMIPLQSPWPFFQWGVDLLGPFPRAPGGYEHVIVVVDYFTKWVEAEPLNSISGRSVQKFLWRNLVCRFGIPRVLVSDNGRQFADSFLQGWCAELGIRQHFTSVGHPQANGQVENVNKTILHGLKTRIESAQTGWIDELPTILWAYRTTPRTATQETPFALTYGAEAVIPAEIGVPSSRVQNFIVQDNEDELRLSLDLLEQRRDEAAIRMAKYKGQVTQHYNARVRHLYFKPGDLVLRKNSVSRARGTSKLDPNWEGPYVVKEADRAGYYKLAHLSGEEVPRTWHNSNLRIFR
ncbi:uncharacterized protein LOC113776533 [Coffea eugenioides]|uniref:uncharacterized protein LOC113776533 n=1 Tax=Coffea eugenioides TaxID=49369 RepID=UPI000F605AD3|nr:uncharacterized protein LOC113776533 [Coffea eugenioides]